MFLKKLEQYADQIDLPPPMYQRTSVRYVINLDDQGNYKGIVEFTDGKNIASLSCVAPNCKRSSGIKPKLLVDNAEYTLGVGREKSDPRRVQEQHTTYVTLVRECAVATREPSVVAVAHFLASPAVELVTKEKSDFDPSSNITFLVDSVYPFEQRTVQEYWAKKAAASDAGEAMQCLVCGEMRPPVERLPIVIKGIPGGQATGLTLISANAAAFESYGLNASLIAPTCEVCGERFGNALNTLLRQKHTHIIISPLAYIFWVRSTNRSTPEIGGRGDRGDIGIPDLMDADPDAVKELLQAPRGGNRTAITIDDAEFYAATLSASGARVVVRDWLETSLGIVRQHLRRYFWLQRIQLPTGELHFFPLYQLINATINPNIKEKPVSHVGEALMHLALHGGQLPVSLLHRAVRRIRAGRKVLPEQAALIKMVLLSQCDTLTTDYERDYTMTTVHEGETNTAYLCGRLLAQLDYIQYRALGKVNATIVDRFYGTASTAPALVFPRLLKGVIPHLATIRQERSKEGKGYVASLSYPDKDLAQLLESLTSFPAILTFEEQGMFALGFYHQKAKYIAQAQERQNSSTNTPDKEETTIEAVASKKE